MIACISFDGAVNCSGDLFHGLLPRCIEHKHLPEDHELHRNCMPLDSWITSSRCIRCKEPDKIVLLLLCTLS